jgi:hypothetical protein
MTLAFRAVLILAVFASRPVHARDGRPMDVLWADLEKGDAEASRALLAMSDRPMEAVAFLKEKLQPLAIEAEKVRALIDWLGSDDEAVWKGASEQLEYFDPRLAIDLETLMREVLETPARQRLVEVLSGRAAGSLAGRSISLNKHGADAYNFSDPKTGSWWAEVRIDRLGTGWGTTKKKWTRAVRAIALLEHIATPEALTILKAMAAGHPDAQPTKVAAESLARVTGAGK